jgi:hypothetical protein
VVAVAAGELDDVAFIAQRLADATETVEWRRE